MRGRIWLTAVFAVVVTAAAVANSHSQTIAKLLEQGQTQKAFDAATAQLQVDAGDNAVRFYQALAAARLGKSKDAISGFKTLAEAHPDSPVIHNNLAVLYAKQGDFDAARAEFLAALATDDRYQTAYKNLTDLYAAQAAQAYNRALAKDEQRSLPKPDLALISQPDLPAADTPAPTQLAGTTTATEERAVDADQDAATAPAEPPAKPTAKSHSQPAAPAPLKVAATSAPAKSVANQPAPAVAADIKPQASAEPKATPARTKAEPKEAPTQPKPVQPKPVQAKPATEQAAVHKLNQAEPAATAVAVGPPPQELITAANAPASPAPDTAPKPAPEPPKAPAKTKAVDKPAAKPKVADSATAKPEPAAKPAAVASTKAQPEATPKAVKMHAQVTAVQQAVAAWAAAWSDQDVAAYLSAYQPDYRPGPRLSHTAWAAQRKGRVGSPKFIRVKLSQMQVKLLDDRHAQVQFRQKYESDDYQDNVLKQLLLVKAGKAWKITREDTIGH